MKNVLGIDYYTVKEIGVKLNLAIVTVRLMITQKKLNAVKIGNSWLVTENELQRYVESRSNNANL
jgi:excisionase family DNA binding protein